MSVGSRWMLSLRSPGSGSGSSSSSSSTQPQYRPVNPSRRLRQTALLLTAVLATLAGGTVGFRLILHESWFRALYRTVMSVTLAGLDTVPSSNGARALSIAMVLCGLTIIAYVGAVIVESITGGVLAGVLAERRRERAIERLSDHYIIRGY